MPAPSSKHRPIRPEIVIPIVLALLGFVAFVPALFGPFLWDDVNLIIGNASVHSLSSWRTWFGTQFMDATSEQLGVTQSIRYYRPLITASYAIEYHFVGERPFLFHLDNLLLHGALGALAFFSLRRWSGSIVAATVAAALFAIHPTKAENVAWISGRTDIICALFILAAGTGAAWRMRGVRHGLVLEIAATILAYSSKEVAVVLPAFVAIEAWVVRGRPALNWAEVKPMIWAALPQCGLAILYLIARAQWFPIRPTEVELLFSDRLFFLAESMGRYVALMLVPYPLSGQHALLRYLDGLPFHDVGYVVFGLFAIITLFMLAFIHRRRTPLVTVGLGLFVAGLLPVCNIVPMHISVLIAERFLYLPSLGFVLAIAAAVESIRVRVDFRPLVTGAIMALLSLVGMAFHRAIDFSDARRFWQRELTLHPESIDALRYNIADALAQNDFAEAERLCIDARNVSVQNYRKGLDVDFVLQFVKLRSWRLVDVDQASLDAIDKFYQTVLDPEAKVAHLQLPDIALSLPLTGRRSARVRALRYDVLLSQADILSRVGRDPDALAALAAATRACTTCARATKQQVLITARAGEYGKAREMLGAMAHADPEMAIALRKTLDAAESAHKNARAATGPMALQLEAMAYSTLGAWGRAYRVLAPYRSEIEQAPNMVIGFAELAFRAGDESVARAILDKHVAAEQVEPILERWRRKSRSK
ncbi:MAG TPA: hypothetical protein PK156_01970 [Polyangium sp.]|nr:hypothetical protein [Polyangium sp.]